MGFGSSSETLSQIWFIHRVEEKTMSFTTVSLAKTTETGPTIKLWDEIAVALDNNLTYFLHNKRTTEALSCARTYLGHDHNAQLFLTKNLPLLFQAAIRDLSPNGQFCFWSDELASELAKTIHRLLVNHLEDPESYTSVLTLICHLWNASHQPEIAETASEFIESLKDKLHTKPSRLVNLFRKCAQSPSHSNLEIVGMVALHVMLARDNVLSETHDELIVALVNHFGANESESVVQKLLDFHCKSGHDCSMTFLDSWLDSSLNHIFSNETGAKAAGWCQLTQLVESVWRMTSSSDAETMEEGAVGAGKPIIQMIMDKICRCDIVSQCCNDPNRTTSMESALKTVLAFLGEKCTNHGKYAELMFYKLEQTYRNYNQGQRQPPSPREVSSYVAKESPSIPREASSHVATESPSINKPEVNELVCVVCQEHESVVACIPCGHRCLCVHCGKRLSRREKMPCPICRTTVAGIFRIYDC